jgi:hypothetical protein
MMMLKNQPGFPQGTIAAVPSALFDAETGELKEMVGVALNWSEKKIASRLMLQAPESEDTPTDAQVVLCADKIFTSPALYPGDVFGATPEVASRHLKTGAAHLATPEDLKRFYDPNRGLAPDKVKRAAETSSEMAVQAHGLREGRSQRRTEAEVET